MIEQVKLSHGIFSARYGRTISGLLELQSKKPSSTETEIEFGISTSAVNLNVSVPINNKGGFMIMGKITYWDAYIALVKKSFVFDKRLRDDSGGNKSPFPACCGIFRRI